MSRNSTVETFPVAVSNREGLVVSGELPHLTDIVGSLPSDEQSHRPPHGDHGHIFGNTAPDNAFLAWDTSLAAGEVWRWDGEVPLSGRYFYAKAGGSGLTILISKYWGTP